MKHLIVFGLLNSIVALNAWHGIEFDSLDLKLSSFKFTCSTIKLMPKPGYEGRLMLASFRNQGVRNVQQLGNTILAAPVITQYDWAGEDAQDYYRIQAFLVDPSNATNVERVSVRDVLTYEPVNTNIPCAITRHRISNPLLNMSHTMTKKEYAQLAGAAGIAIGAAVLGGYGIKKLLEAEAWKNDYKHLLTIPTYSASRDASKMNYKQKVKQLLQRRKEQVQKEITGLDGGGKISFFKMGLTKAKAYGDQEAIAEYSQEVDYWSDRLHTLQEKILPELDKQLKKYE